CGDGVCFAAGSGTCTHSGPGAVCASNASCSFSACSSDTDCGPGKVCGIAGMFTVCFAVGPWVGATERVMNQMTLPKIEPPAALHRAASDLPFVTFLDGLDFQLLQASVENGLWVVRTRFQPGVTIATHRHTGEVFAVTFAGSWRYLEYPEVNTAGSHLYEPAGSEHTLHVP